MAKILVVEDDENLRETLKIWLETLGYRVETVGSGEEALGSMCREDSDVIVLDWLLPDMEGPDVAKRYRQSGGKSLILMLTGKNDQECVEAALGAGADEYLSKPFVLEDLAERLAAMLGKNRSAVGGAWSPQPGPQ